MRISDWSSDVCSSDLRQFVDVDPLAAVARRHQPPAERPDPLDHPGDIAIGIDAIAERHVARRILSRPEKDVAPLALGIEIAEIGKAPCRESVWPFGSFSVVCVYLQ